MRLAGIEDTDIMLDEYGQPVVEAGIPQIVSGKECLLQDIRCEMLTEEGELIYEDEEGKEAYGYGLLEFLNGEDDILGEIQARIIEKLSKREDIDESSIKAEVVVENKGRIRAIVSFNTSDDKENSIEVNVDETGVYIE
ncbi:DUF2634 domain-containing protein [Ruminococcus sp. 5_1_39BFAA]|uniref:DUF2634 domain-containing protein n=1 Tax=Ruminococcus sp. 5_1_39BFAA TaxID=457412 RepID=UPI00356802BF